MGAEAQFKLTSPFAEGGEKRWGGAKPAFFHGGQSAESVGGVIRIPAGEQGRKEVSDFVTGIVLGEFQSVGEEFGFGDEDVTASLFIESQDGVEALIAFDEVDQETTAIFQRGRGLR